MEEEAAWIRQIHQITKVILSSRKNNSYHEGRASDVNMSSGQYGEWRG